jgi:hypothetical protein
MTEDPEKEMGKNEASLGEEETPQEKEGRTDVPDSETEDVEAPYPEAPEAEPAEEIEEPVPPEPELETRGQRFLRLAIRWLAGILILFGLGVIATVFLLYRPTTDELSRAREELVQSEQRVSELEAEVERLQSLEAENETLQEELNQARLHIQILSALSDVNAARLDLANDDLANARLDLTNTPQTLERLGELVEPEQQEAVEAMQSRLDLALEGIDRDTFAAQSDLRVLATNLMQLENTFFTNR